MSATSVDGGPQIRPLRRPSVRERWYREVIRTRLVKGACRELLAHLAVVHMTERGYVKVPREALARELDIPLNRVTDRIAKAVKAGLLVKDGGGRNGQVARYHAQLVDTQVPTEQQVPTDEVPTEQVPADEVVSGVLGTGPVVTSDWYLQMPSRGR
jgi:hypothetical protein